MGAAKLVPPYSLASAGGLVGADVEGEVRVCRNVRAVAKRRRALVARVDHARELLPRGDRDPVRRDAAAAVRPGGFRLPGAGRAGGDQVRAADGNDIRIVRRPGLISRRPGGSCRPKPQRSSGPEPPSSRSRGRACLDPPASSPTSSRWWWAAGCASSWR